MNFYVEIKINGSYPRVRPDAHGPHPSRRFDLRGCCPLLFCLCSALVISAACGSKSPAAPTVASTSKLAPAPAAPANGDPVTTFRPTVAVRNVTSDQSGTKTYEFQISDTSDFSTVV